MKNSIVITDQGEVTQVKFRMTKEQIMQFVRYAFDKEMEKINERNEQKETTSQESQQTISSQE